MSKGAKIWLIAAVSLILIGGILFGAMMTVLSWDFTKLSTNKYETDRYEISEAFSSISIDTDTADVKLLPSESEKCSIECYEQRNEKHAVSVKDGTLEIKVSNTKKWYEHIGINFDSPKITIYIPKREYRAFSLETDTGDIEIAKDFGFESIDISSSTGDVTNYASASGTVKIKTSTGSIRTEDISAEALDISVSTGKVTVSGVTCEGDASVKVSTGKAYLSDLTCKNLISDGDTGDLSLKNVIASEKLSIERDTGDVKFDGCDAAEILVETDTGDVTGTLLSEKIFIAKSDTGDVRIPETMSGGKCKITTDTGDIRIGIKQ